MFYVYVLMDRRKPGIYNYAGLEFLFEPFYVGKGSGSRLNSHHSEKTRTYKTNKVKAIMAAGLRVMPVLIVAGLSEDDAFKAERATIQRIGRKLDGAGPLTNLTLGGEGLSGHQHGEETRAKMRGPKTPEQIANMVAAWTRTPNRMTEDVKASISRTLLGRPLPEEVRRKMLGRIPWNKGKRASPKDAERLRQYAKARAFAAAIRRLGEPAKGPRIYLKGYKLTDEQKARFSGWHHTDEAKDKIGAARRGKPRSEEVKAKIRATKAANKASLIGNQ